MASHLGGRVLRQQFEAANYVQTPHAAIAIASTFGLSTACGSQANQADSENDVHLFGIVQECCPWKQSDSLCPPRSSTYGPDSAPASAALTIASADWRRTDSEQAEAVRQFVNNQVVLPASASESISSQPDRVSAEDPCSCGPDSASKVTALRTVPATSLSQPQHPLSQMGTVQDTQTDPNASSNAASGGGKKPVPEKEGGVPAAGIGGMCAELGGPQIMLPSAAQSEVHTIMETQGGSSHPSSKDFPPQQPVEACRDEFETDVEQDEFPATQIQGIGDLSSFPSTQLEPKLPSCPTAPTEIVDDVHIEDLVSHGPAHSTDTQPANAPICMEDCMTAVEECADGILADSSAHAATSRPAQEGRASMNPLLPVTSRVPGTASLLRHAHSMPQTDGLPARLSGQLAPPVACIESGNTTCLSVQLTHEASFPVNADSDVPPEMVSAGDPTSLPNVGSAVPILAADTSQLKSPPHATQVHAAVGSKQSPARSLDIAAGHLAISKYPAEGATGCMRMNNLVSPGQDCNQLECGKVTTVGAAEAICRTVAKAHATQATVCDSSDCEVQDVRLVERIPGARAAPVQIKQTLCCESVSCGTVPDTYTGDGKARALPSQQTVRQARDKAATALQAKVTVQIPVPQLSRHQRNGPCASPTPSAAQCTSPHAHCAAPSARASAQLAAAIARSKSTPSTTPGGCKSAGTPGKSVSALPKASPRSLPAQPSQAAAGSTSRLRMDRIARKRKAQQQQSARIQKVAPTTPLPALPRTSPLPSKSMPKSHSTRTPDASPHASPLLQLDAGLRNSLPRTTPVRGRSVGCSVPAATPPPQQTPSPLPRKAARRALAQTAADLPHCTLQQPASGPPRPSGTYGKAQHSPRPHVDAPRSDPQSPACLPHSSAPPLAAAHSSRAIREHVPQQAATPAHTGWARRIAPASPTPPTKVMADKGRDKANMFALGDSLAEGSVQQEQVANAAAHRCKGVSDTCAAAAMMTDSQLSLQNWIDERPHPAQVHRRLPAPAPPKFSDTPSRCENSGSLPNVTPAHSMELNAIPAAASPDGLEHEPEIEEHDIQQVRSKNKPQRVLDSQTEELFDRCTQPDSPALQSTGAAARSTATERDRRALKQQGTLDTQGLHVRVQRSTSGGHSPGTSAPILAMATPIPCVFVSSQQGTESCMRQRRAEEEAGLQRAAAAGAQQLRHFDITSIPNMRSMGVVARGAGAARPAQKQASASCVSPLGSRGRGPAKGLGAAEATGSERPCPQSAPAGSDRQKHGSRVGTQAAPGAPFAGTPCLRSPNRAVESPNGSVRRSARIAAHNITLAADANKAFGALPQACSLECADALLTPTRSAVCPAAAPAKRGVPDSMNQKGGHSHATRLSPSPKRQRCSRRSLPQSDCHYARTPARAGSNDENRRSQDRGFPSLRAFTPQKRRQNATHSDKAARTPQQRSRRTASGRADAGATADNGAESVPPGAHKTTGGRSPCGNTVSARAPSSHRELGTGHIAPGIGMRLRHEDVTDDISWGKPAQFCSAWRQTYSAFTSRTHGEVKLGDVICAEGDGGQKLYIQTDQMWSNPCTKEDCVSGIRLYPVLHTPFSIFVPGGVEKERAMALGDDRWTIPRRCFRYPVRVAFMGSGDRHVSESDAKKMMLEDPHCCVCHFRLEANGGLFPL